MYAYAPHGVVTDVREHVPDFHPDLTTQYRRVPDGIADQIAPGWVAVENGYAPPGSDNDLPRVPGSQIQVLTYKADLYRRATEAEAEQIETALNAAPVRQRRLFEAAQYLDHADPEFAAMHEALVGLFGEERADVLLAPSR